MKLTNVARFHKAVKDIGLTDDDTKLVLNHLLGEIYEKYNELRPGVPMGCYPNDWVNIISIVLSIDLPEVGKKYPRPNICGCGAEFIPSYGEHHRCPACLSKEASAAEVATWPEA